MPARGRVTEGRRRTDGSGAGRAVQRQPLEAFSEVALQLLHRVGAGGVGCEAVRLPSPESALGTIDIRWRERQVRTCGITEKAGDRSDTSVK